ncbi:MAG: thioesterase family protein [Ferruginibacter sp.]
MARIKIDIPVEILCVIDIPVRISDINYGNHVGNDALVSIVQEARVQMLQRAGYKNELEIEGVGLIMAGLAMEYKKEAFYGDVLQIAISVNDITAVSFNLFFKINAQRNEQMIFVAKAKSEMVCYDYTIKKIAGIPSGLKIFLENH